MTIRKTRVETLDPANTCSWCPHALVRLGSGTLWCPCEDCHPGGRIQGRAYKAEATPVTRTEQPVTPTEDSPLWVDPVHSL